MQIIVQMNFCGNHAEFLNQKDQLIYMHIEVPNIWAGDARFLIPYFMQFINTDTSSTMQYLQTCIIASPN